MKYCNTNAKQPLEFFSVMHLLELIRYLFPLHNFFLMYVNDDLTSNGCWNVGREILRDEPSCDLQVIWHSNSSLTSFYWFFELVH